VKELYHYLDATPTHSYLKMLYRYPQRAFPYQQLLDENRKRDRTQTEYDLPDTGIFDDGRWFDVVVEYAKAEAEDILMRVTVRNRGPERAVIHVAPQLCFRNNWSWKPGATLPSFCSRLEEPFWCGMWTRRTGMLDRRGAAEPFTGHETNQQRSMARQKAPTQGRVPEYIVHGRREAVNPSTTDQGGILAEAGD